MTLTAATVLTPSEAARHIGGREATARAWLRDRGLVRDIPGLGRRVIWGDVLEAMRRADDPPAPPAAPPSRLPRAGLRRT